MDKSVVKDYGILIAGAVTFAKVLTSAFGFDFIADEAIDDVVTGISAIVVVWVGWKNTYVSPKSQIQKKKLKANGLIK